MQFNVNPKKSGILARRWSDLKPRVRRELVAEWERAALADTGTVTAGKWNLDYRLVQGIHKVTEIYATR